MNLLLEFAIYFIQHLEANQVIPDQELVAVLEKRFVDWLAVQQRSICRIQVDQTVSDFAG